MTPIIRPFREADREELVALWVECALVRPQNDPDRDIDRKLAQDAAQLLVAETAGRIVGSVMLGYDGHRGWLNYVAVQPALQRTGLGRELVAEAERELALLGCPKINLQVRATNPGAIEFYRSVGYVIDEVVSMGKRIVFEDAPRA